MGLEIAAGSEIVDYPIKEGKGHNIYCIPRLNEVAETMRRNTMLTQLA